MQSVIKIITVALLLGGCALQPIDNSNTKYKCEVNQYGGIGCKEITIPNSILMK